MMTDGRFQGVWLNDVALTSVHPSILLQHISEGELELNMQTANRPAGGLFTVYNRPTKREIVIEFAIREHLSYARRAEAFQAVCAWASAGGWLELSDHAGQMIYVTCTKFPSLGRLREWAEDMSITFEALDWPFWVDKYQTLSVQEGITSGTVDMRIAGTHDAYLEFELTPASGTLTSISLSANDTQMTFNLQYNQTTPGQILKLYYDNYHYLHFDKGSAGILRRRSGDDDIIIKPAASNTITYAFDTACDVTFKVRGVWI